VATVVGLDEALDAPGGRVFVDARQQVRSAGPGDVAHDLAAQRAGGPTAGAAPVEPVVGGGVQAERRAAQAPHDAAGQAVGGERRRRHRRFVERRAATAGGDEQRRCRGGERAAAPGAGGVCATSHCAIAAQARPRRVRPPRRGRACRAPLLLDRGAAAARSVSQALTPFMAIAPEALAAC
jgi:hypothetical protein